VRPSPLPSLAGELIDARLIVPITDIQLLRLGAAKVPVVQSLTHRPGAISAIRTADIIGCSVLMSMLYSRECAKKSSGSWTLGTAASSDRLANVQLFPHAIVEFEGSADRQSLGKGDGRIVLSAISSDTSMPIAKSCTFLLRSGACTNRSQAARLSVVDA